MLDSIEAIRLELPWFFGTWVFILGACVGSFLNVCIYRIPEGLSVVKPRSRCGKCGKPIPFYHNIPILSWIILRGKAACCGAPFSIRYPFVELLTGLLFLFCWFEYPPLVAIAGMVFCGLMIPASFIDIDHMIIPDRFSIGGMVIGVILAALIPSLHGYTHDLPLLNLMRSTIAAITGAFIGSALVLWVGLLAEVLLRKEAMGFGDVKLMGAIGAFCGWQGTVFSLFAGAILGMIGFVFAKLFARPKPQTEASDAISENDQQPGSFDQAMPAAGEIPFGPALAAAAVLYFLFLREPVDSYFTGLQEVLFPAASAQF